MKFTYKDVSPISKTGGGKPLILFEIEANSIIEADKAFEKETGKKPKGTIVVSISH